jgi:hypothetical protein
VLAVRAPRTLIAAPLVAALAVAGCGGSSSSTSNPASAPAGKTTTHEVSPSGDIPDNQAWVRVAAPGGFSVKVPEGWSRTSAGKAVVFSDKRNSVRMEAVPAAGPITVAEAKRTTPGATVKTVARAAGPAVVIVYTAPGTPDPVTGKSVPSTVERYVFFHGGKRIVLTLSAPKGADNVDPWKIVTGSLRYAR